MYIHNDTSISVHKVTPRQGPSKTNIQFPLPEEAINGGGKRHVYGFKFLCRIGEQEHGITAFTDASRLDLLHLCPDKCMKHPMRVRSKKKIGYIELSQVATTFLGLCVTVEERRPRRQGHESMAHDETVQEVPDGPQNALDDILHDIGSSEMEQLPDISDIGNFDEQIGQEQAANHTAPPLQFGQDAPLVNVTWPNVVQTAVNTIIQHSGNIDVVRQAISHLSMMCQHFGESSPVRRIDLYQAKLILTERYRDPQVPLEHTKYVRALNDFLEALQNPEVFPIWLEMMH